MNTPRIPPAGLGQSNQGRSHVVRSHDVEEVAVVGVEGHDVVDGLAGGQLQRPLVGHGHVRPEGELWRRRQVGTGAERCRRLFYFIFFNSAGKC